MNLEDEVTLIYNIREWKMPEINTTLWIAENYDNNSTITVNPSDYEATKKRKYFGEEYYVVYQRKSFYEEYQQSVKEK